MSVQREEDQSFAKISEDLQTQLENASQRYEKAEQEISTCNLANQESYQIQIEEESNFYILQKELDDSKELLQVLKIRIENTKENQSRVMKETGTGEKDLALMKNKEMEFNNIIKEEKTKISEEKSQVNNLEMEVSKYEQQLEDKDIEIKDRQKKKDEKRQYIELLKKKRTKEAYQELQQRIEEERSIQLEIEKLEEQRQRVQSRKTTAESKKSQIFNDLQTLIKINDENISTQKEMKQQIKQKEESVTELKQQLASLKEDLQTSLQNHQSYCGKISELEQKKLEGTKKYLEATRKIEMNERNIVQILIEQSLSKQTILDRRLELINVQQRILFQSLESVPKYKTVQNQ